VRRFSPILFLLPLFLCSAQADASVDIHLEPAVIFLSDANRAGAFTVTSSEKQDIIVSLRVIYGRPGGSVDTAYLDAAPADESRSFVPYVKLKEDSFRLRAGERHTVTIDAAIPASAAQGEYCALVVVSWSMPEPAAPSEPGTEALSKSVGLVYRKGNPIADIKLVGAGAERKETIVRFFVEVTLLGDAAYRGNAHVEIRNTALKSVFTCSSMIDIYGKQRLTFDIKGGSIPPGLYKAVVRFDTERPDLGDAVIPVLPKKYTIDFKMP
jgi:hypothetical protein